MGARQISGWNDEAASFYLATAAQVLPKPIPFEDLTRVSAERPLAPGMLRGYALVYLPELLMPWYEQGVHTWTELRATFPTNAA